MPLKLTCPKCRATIPLVEPYPVPGDAVQCSACGSSLSVSYPEGAMESLKARGKRFRESFPERVLVQIDPYTGSPPPIRRPAHIREGLRPSPDPTPPQMLPRAPLPPPGRRPDSPPRGFEAPPPETYADGPSPTQAATVADRTAVDPTMVDDRPSDPFPEIDRTVPAMRTPYGALPGNLPEPDAEPAAKPDRQLSTLDAPPRRTQTPKKGRSPWRWARRGAMLAAIAVGATAVLVALIAVGTYVYYSRELPTVEALNAYKPPTVTVVLDKDGNLLGEVYDERRYVLPLEEIPKHVQNAFIAAEDANFWNHGGVDYMGIVRAMGRNLKSGRMAQGASTITQQVTRNFLLSSDKKLERKIKEVILAWRIEATYDKEHILYLYLNEIYLGSHSYGVEAASRTYFDKSVKDLTVAEAAILAGLPQRPSDYSPHRGWDRARARQEYVIAQMVANGYLTEAEAASALAEHVKIARKDNAFLEKAPHFTEYARRYLVEKYGEQRVLHEGLVVKTTCDQDLQEIAQKAVTGQVFEVDQRMGFRRDAIEHLTGDAAIEERRTQHEKAMREALALEQDPAGRVPMSERSQLRPGEVYEAVLLEVKPSYARVGIGVHEGVIPIGWSDWVYAPNPHLSWRFRKQDDLTTQVDVDGDRKMDGSILQRGDVVLVKVEALSTKDERVSKVFAGTPGETDDRVAVRLWQDPKVEAATLSYDLHTGAVRAMVGGSDFGKSQFNRAVQSYRQVGSTFKPIVYAAALGTKKITTATMVTDAPVALATNDDFIWKPANYGNDYEGNMTIRLALAASKNTCTVRVIEAIDPGMNDDVVYKTARSLGIGGPPSHLLSTEHVTKPDNDRLCPWIREEKEFQICMDRWPPKDPNISNTRHRQLMGPDDVYMCRACDMSMALGSTSLSMLELMRAYSAFATQGKLVEPYFFEEVKDRDGNVLERHQPVEPVQVMDPMVASLTNWLLEAVVSAGTGYDAKKALPYEGLAGKTGTSNDEKDTWFVGYTNDVITGAWVGFDEPESLGPSSTGGRTALPIWVEVMKKAAPPEKDRRIPVHKDLVWAQIDEETGRRVSRGGRPYPFLPGTQPEATGVAAGQMTIQDLTTEL